MSTLEAEILAFLQTCPRVFVSARQVGRQIGSRKQYLENPSWAKPILRGMVRQALLETNATGQFRFVPAEEDAKNKKKNRIAVSPDVAAILKRSGKDFTEVVALDE